MTVGEVIALICKQASDEDVLKVVNGWIFYYPKRSNYISWIY